MGEVLDGKKLSALLRKSLTEEIKTTMFKKKYPHQPQLAAVLVGDDSASQVYIRQKEKACLEVGIKFKLFKLPEESTTEEVLETVSKVNLDKSIHGCLVQLPLPKQVNEDLVIASLDVDKDVDCFHAENIGKLSLNKARFIPATPFGIKLMLEHYQVQTKGKHCVIVGKSLIVGQPLMNLMSLENGMGATVTCCDRWTENLKDHTSRADILVVAAGVHHLIKTPDMVKKGATVIDVGIHRIPDESKKNGYRLEGDVNYPEIVDHCQYITPVPGGVGPMTVVSLLFNTWTAFTEQMSRR